MTDSDLLLFWAKLGKAAYSRRHPLLCHLLDVAAVARQLWYSVVRGALKDRIAATLRVDGAVARLLGRPQSRWLRAVCRSHGPGTGYCHHCLCMARRAGILLERKGGGRHE